MEGRAGNTFCADGWHEIARDVVANLAHVGKIKCWAVICERALMSLIARVEVEVRVRDDDVPVDSVQSS